MSQHPPHAGAKALSDVAHHAPRSRPRTGQRHRRGVRFLRNIPTWVLWLLVLVWLIPTFGLFVNSFRGKDVQRNSGWWTVLPATSTEGLQNYKAVLRAASTGR